MKFNKMIASKFSFKFSQKAFSFKNVVIVNGKRTPVGSFMGKLSGVSAQALGSSAIQGALNAAKLQPEEVEEVIMGNVLSAGIGQAPARQAAIMSELLPSTICTTINKVCSSGMKSVMYAAQGIMLGDRDIVVAGGMESMSMVPHYIYMRRPLTFGNANLIDGIQFDGLSGSFNGLAMGHCAEHTNKELKITRQEMDEYSIMSYERANKAHTDKLLEKEIIPLERTVKKDQTELIDSDEEIFKFMKDKIPKLKPVFDEKGGITAANASKINDGAAALLLMSEDRAKSLNLSPVARIVGFEDAEIDPIDFSLAPTSAIQKLLQKTNRKISDIDYFEINEAFASVALANMKLLNLSADKVNVHGGAVAFGHPIGMSGSRIILSLINVLQSKNGKLGVAAICNGGGGASTIMIERLN